MSALATGLFAALIFAGTPKADDPNDVKLVQRAYPVGDLVLKPAPKADAGKANAGVINAEEAGDPKPLVELLTETIAPGTWAEEIDQNGKTNAMVYFLLNRSLIVRATPEVHGQVVKRLRQLRRLAPLQND